jgi:hypothetical protein
LADLQGPGPLARTPSAEGGAMGPTGRAQSPMVLIHRGNGGRIQSGGLARSRSGTPA